MFHSDEFADDNIIQFQLGGLATDTKTVLESVNLLLRIKYIKTLKQSIHELNSDININAFNQSLGQSIDGLPLSKHLTKTENGQKRALPITIIVSNVTESGEADVILTKVKSMLKKSITMKLSLPVDLIEHSSDGKQQTLRLYLRCVGCGKRAILILTHKLRRRQRHKGKQKSNPQFLHKRRPILFIQSRIAALS